MAVFGAEILLAISAAWYGGGQLLIGAILFWFLMFPLMIVQVVAHRKGLAVVTGRDFRVCPQCRYFLTGLSDVGACPECGQAFLHETLKIIWKDSYQIREAINTPSTPSPHTPHTPPASPTPPPGASTN